MSMVQATPYIPTYLKASLAFLLAAIIFTVSLLMPGTTRLFAQSTDSSTFMVDINQNATAIHVVQRGDTMGSIARRYNTDISTLLRLNPNISNPNRIQVGQRIVVPAPSRPGQPGPGQPGQPGQGISITRIHMIGLGTNGPLGCGDTVVPVLQEVPATNAILRATLERLLSVRTQFYGQSGLYNALYLSNLTVGDITINNRVATIHLSGQVILGGTCDGPRIRAQLEEAALQFSTIDAVRIFVNGRLLQDILSEQ